MLAADFAHKPLHFCLVSVLSPLHADFNSLLTPGPSTSKALRLASSHDEYHASAIQELRLPITAGFPAKCDLGQRELNDGKGFYPLHLTSMRLDGARAAV